MDKRAVEKPRQHLSKLIIYRVLLAIFAVLAAVFFMLWRETSAKYIKIGYPEGGDRILAADYADRDNWMAIAPEPDKSVDVFFIYPTSWRAKPGEYPISSINNPEMRHWAKYNLDTRGSAFKTAGNMYAPFYRQLDAGFALSQESTPRMFEYMAGVPYADIKAAFDYYIKHFNKGRPFIIAAHSQGSAMGLLLLIDYMKERQEVYKRMVAAYLIGLSVTQAVYDACPWLKAAQQADDTGVIISYNTQTAVVDAPGNPFSNKNAVLINPISWQINNKKMDASQGKGGVAADEDTGEISDLGAIADARIAQAQCVIITDVDRYRFSSDPGSRGYFPLGVLHENDIPLFYYDLRANAELRAKAFLSR